MRPTGFRFSSTRSCANGSTIIHVPSVASEPRTWRRGAHRVAHVVQAVEECHEVEVRSRIALRARDLEVTRPATPARDALRAPTRSTAVVVEADERRLAERLRQQDGRRAVPAADVGDAPPRRSFSSTPSSAGIHSGSRCAA
jgi:hypothetical protein